MPFLPGYLMQENAPSINYEAIKTVMKSTMFMH